MTASISFLAPVALLLCLTALLPIGVLVVLVRRHARAAAAVGLRPAGARGAIATTAVASLACIGLGLAAAQPVLTETDTLPTRTGSEVVYVVDVSRSMLASARPGSPTRLARAQSIVRRMHDAVDDVPSGISGLTDRLLPYVFPTADPRVFDETLDRSVGIETPPPRGVEVVATSFEPLAGLPTAGFFTPGTRHRTCVLVTDGETRSAAGVGGPLARRGGCRLVVVRVGDGSERITVPGALDETGPYRPEATAAAAVERLARSADGSAYDESQVDAATDAVRASAEQGPTATVGTARTVTSLAPYLVGAAIALAVLVVAAAALRLSGRRLRPVASGHYDPGEVRA